MGAVPYAISTARDVHAIDACDRKGSEAMSKDGSEHHARTPHETEVDSATQRGWDGWPTPPTPNYLIPKMGELPVSSTAHYRTVVLSDIMEGDISPMWKAIREPLLAAMKKRAKLGSPDLQLIRAVYGHVPTNLAPPIVREMTSSMSGTETSSLYLEMLI